MYVCMYECNLAMSYDTYYLQNCKEDMCSN